MFWERTWSERWLQIEQTSNRKSQQEQARKHFFGGETKGCKECRAIASKPALSTNYPDDSSQRGSNSFQDSQLSINLAPKVPKRSQVQANLPWLLEQVPKASTNKCDLLCSRLRELHPFWRLGSCSHLGAVIGLS